MGQHRSMFRVEKMCKVLKVSRSGFYKYLQHVPSKRSLENQKLLKEIKLIHLANKQVYGSPRMRKALNLKGFKCSENRVAKLMQKNNIKAKTKKKFRPQYSKRDKTKLASPNLVKQNFTVQNINQIWTSDITYIKTNEGWLYLAVIIDIFSRNIIAWKTDKRMKESLISDMLRDTIFTRNITKGIIFHSDRGSQYTSTTLRLLLKRQGFLQSMNATGNCYDNAITETFFHTLKTEYVNHQNFISRKQAQAGLFEYIELFYKRKRLHSSLNYLSPIQFEHLYSKT
ncbi:IS3 family transposase [bacterium]